jgi:hypothetical protein
MRILVKLGNKRSNELENYSASIINIGIDIYHDFGS